MAGIIDADTHIAEGEAMWAMMDKEMYPRRPVLLKEPGGHALRPAQRLLADRRQYFSQAQRQGQLSSDHAVGDEVGNLPRRYSSRLPGNDRYPGPAERHGQAQR